MVTISRNKIWILTLFSLITSTHLRGAGLELDPDELRGSTSKKPVSVLQNRFYLKAWRPELGTLVGTINNEAYTDTKLHGFRIGLFLNEWVGLETQHILTTVKDSADRKALKKKIYRDLVDEDKKVTADAEVNPINQVQDLVAVAAPLYGKVNIFDMALVYVDLYGTFGVSRVTTEQGIKTAVTAGAGQRFYWGDRWSMRLDFRNRSYTETRAGTNSRKNAWSTDFGVSYLFL